MDTVKSFNQELSSLYEVKPPISKAKMTALTRGAIKAIKFYKHVVQSVEKFILKCKSEYKVPGLYVIDSIVRQSRHQFGADRDVFAPRFAKNMQQTFVNLFKCPPEDKSKIIRVLNLWQKNNVFLPEVIQPLFDLADPNNPIYKEIDAMQQSANGFNNTSTSIAKGSPALQRTPTKGQQGNETLHGTSTNLNLTDPSVLQQLQQLQRLISKNVENSTRTEPVHFDKKLLDFDYDEDDDDIHPSPRPQQPTAESILPVTSLLTNPEVLRQLQTLQQTMANAAQPQTQDIDTDRLRKMQEMKQQEEEFDKHLAQTVPNLPFAAECEFRSTSNHLPTQGNYYVDGMNPPPPQYHTDFDQQANQIMLEKSHQLQQDNNAEVEVITLDQDDSRSESPGEDRYRKRKRSRSRSRDRRGRDRDRRRSRSRSGSRRRRSRSRERSKKDKDKEKSREERERETERDRERKKRGLPVIKKDHLSVCSTTLWVGHLSKLVHQDDLSNTFGEFGDVVSIDLIPPRGCAFIVMLRRQDAAKCLTRLKGHNLHGKSITLAWAPGKGVKGKDLKDYWEGDLGVSYIPYTKIKHDIDIDLLEDGGMVDEETMPQWMKDKVEKMGKKPSLDIPNFSINTGTTTTTIDTSQPPPIPGAGLLQPPPMLPMFQFNNRLLGMNVPPGMMPNLSNMPSLSNMPNIPIGVPPPNMAGPPLMGLGLGSHFQGFKVGPPNMMPPQLPSLNNKPGNVNADDSLHSIGESLMNITQSFGMVPQPPAPHEDTMDIEMEDAESKPSDNKNSSYNEQPSSQFNRLNRDDDRRDRRDDRRNRSRDGRDNRDRDRSRDRHSRERDRDRRYRNDRDNSRGRDRRDDRRDNRDRDRGNRWENRDRRDNRDSERDDRREKEKTLNDRLREMAGMGGGYDDRNRGDRFNRDREPPFKFAPFRNNGRSEEEFGRDRQRDRVDSNERDRSNESKTKLEEENEKKDGEDQANDKTEDKLDGTIDIKEDEASEKNVEEEKEEEKQNDSTGDSQETKTSENAEGSQKDRKESLNFEAPFDAPPLFDGPPPFDGPPGVFDLPPRSLFGAPPLFNEAPPMFNDGPPPLGMFNDGPPRGFFNDGMMFDEGMPMRGRGRGRGRRGGRDNMRMDGPPDLNMLDGPPMGFPDGPLMMDDRFLRGGRRGGMRGMPRDEFFPRDDFSPRGRGRGRGRGMIFRGRGGRGGFNPRFDGPPYEGLPPFEKPFDELPGPPQFDGPPGPFRGGPRFDGRFRGNQRREDRLWVKPEFNSSPRGGGRRSRWGSSPPPGDDGEGDGGFVEEPFMDEGGESMEERLDVPIESEGGEPDGNGFVEGGDGGEFDDGSGFEPEEAPQDGKCTPVVDERPPPQESGDAEEASDGPPGE